MYKSNLFFAVISLLFISCSPKLSRKAISEFQHVQRDMKQLKKLRNVEKVNTKYPSFNIYHTILPIHKAKTKLEKEALSLKMYEMTKSILNENATCGFVKLIQKGKDSLLRVKYIYLQDKSEQGVLAKKIITDYQKGITFSVLAKQYGKDAISKKGGDYGWVVKNSLVPDFVEAIAKHKKGSVFTVKTDYFGWYVVLKTHDIIADEYLTIVKVMRKKKCCIE